MQKKRKPLRKDLVSKEQYPKNELIRIVKNKDNEIFIDKTGKQNGRGAYLYLSADNIKLAQKQKVLEREFQTKDLDGLYEELMALTHE